MEIDKLNKWYKWKDKSFPRAFVKYFCPIKHFSDNILDWYEGPCITVAQKMDGEKDEGLFIEINSKEYALNSLIENKSAKLCNKPFKELNKMFKHCKSEIFNDIQDL